AKRHPGHLTCISLRSCGLRRLRVTRSGPMQSDLIWGRTGATGHIAVPGHVQKGDEMKLYYSPGTIAFMPFVALVESGLPFVAVRVDEFTKAMQDGGDYRAVNPLGYVPALALDDGTLLFEAAAIAQYVADRDPTGRLAPPNGTIARARLQAWLNFISSELHK